MGKYTAIIIGSGPAGYTAAVRIAQLGGQVAIVERDYVGGICTNWGCTPSKSMIESAKIARTVKESGRYGVRVPDWSVDFKSVAARRDQVIQQARDAIIQLLEHHHVDIYQGEAEALAPGRVRIRRGKMDLEGTMRYSGEEEILEADNLVLATGSHPMIPDFVNKNDPYVVSSNRLISIGSLPETLTIVGGGVIGLEFATIFSNLGSRVTIVEFLDRVLAGMDPEISEEITREMTETGVRILTSHHVLSLANGVLEAEDRTTGKRVQVASKSILIAVGREPVIDKSQFKQLGIEFTNKGISVDDHLQTNIPGIWALGDATGKSILAHVGMQQGLVCAENIMQAGSHGLRRMDYDVIPSVVYSIPEVVGVGHVPTDLNGVSVYKVPFSINLRAQIEGYDQGFAKVWIRDQRLLAAQAIGHNVSEIMQEFANLIALKTPISDVAEVIHAHPTYSEIVRSTLEFALGKSVDLS